jgi:hypothetical protein
MSSELKRVNATLTARLQTLRCEQKVVSVELRRQAEMGRIERRTNMAERAASLAVEREVARARK